MVKISDLKGIGEKTEKLFNKLSIYNAEDLIDFYPRKYDIYSEPVGIRNIEEPGVYAIWGTVVSECEVNTRGRYKIVSVYVSDDYGERMKITWFNMPFLKNSLKRGYKYMFRGEAAIKGSLIFMEQPAIYTYEQYAAKADTMQPVYPLTAGLTNNTVIKAVKQALLLYDEPEFLPDYILKKAMITGLSEAVKDIHFPNNADSLQQARKRLVFDEFFIFSLAVRSVKTANFSNTNENIITKSEYSRKVLDNLGYELTGAQKKVYDEIALDMSGNKAMNRLIQGDVGSGKTIIALLAMFDAAASGYQSVLMAPTEVLARQHYESFCQIIEKNQLPLKCVLMTGSLTANNKKNAKRMTADGEADIIIGTHAVISEGVEFNRLALVITDEQHRFGVRQRQALHHKGNNPHILVMSATPIPRSLAIILYGDLDISIIDEKPANRIPIKNCVVDDSYRTKAYNFIHNEINKGHQAYIICAMAKESEDEDNVIENVIDYTEKIKQALPEIPVKYLHGKMKPSEKNEIMDRFLNGDIKILVSTTVVEVGVNVPNATVMMVENAERFGLAGLHQLRGRVGRGSDQSYCIFVSNTKNKLTKQRLMILKDSNDGFYIAEQDLKLRGPGDMFGLRQSGDFGFAIGDIYADAGILKLAAQCAGYVFENDPTLSKPENGPLKDKLTRYIKNDFNNINI